MTTEAENIFLDKIDCNFPYLESQTSDTLINEAAQISSNALFAVVEEICRVPEDMREQVSHELLLKLLDKVDSKMNHPLKETVLDAARKMIHDQELSVEDAISRMKTIKAYRGEYCALNIIYFSCDDTSGKVESIYEEIIAAWLN